VKLTDQEKLEREKAYKNKAYYKAWYEKNKEKVKAQRKNYREKNKEKIKDYHKAWYELNKERAINNAKSWSEKNKEKAKAHRKKWKNSNSEKIRAYARAYSRAYSKKYPFKVSAMNAKRRAAKLQRTVSWANKKLIQQIYKQAKKLSEQTGELYHVDHIIPLQGKKVSGLHVETNLQVLLAKDNIRKSNFFET